MAVCVNGKGQALALHLLSRRLIIKDSEYIYIKLPKKDVVFFCGFFEAYEGMAVIRTPVRLEGPESLLKLIIAPDFKREINRLLKYLKKTIPIKRVRDAVAETQ